MPAVTMTSKKTPAAMYHGQIGASERPPGVLIGDFQAGGATGAKDANRHDAPDEVTAASLGRESRPLPRQHWREKPVYIDNCLSDFQPCKLKHFGRRPARLIQE